MSELLFSVNNISKIFPGVSDDKPFTALHNITFDIFAGRCLMIAGSNGSGKTLLMRIIAGLMEPSGGDVLYRQRSLFAAGKTAHKRETEQILRREVGLVFQDADVHIVGQTVSEDIAFGPENLRLDTGEIQIRVDNALSALGLADKRDNSPRRLSGGEKRRLAIAGILAMGCTTVIMDEPFANLDWPGIVQTLSIIRDLKNSGKTLIILTHELEKALAFADRLIILHGGNICSDGCPADVMDNLDSAWGVRDPRRNYSAIADCSWL